MQEKMQEKLENQEMWVGCVVWEGIFWEVVEAVVSRMGPVVVEI